MKNAIRSGYQYRNYKIEAGIQLDYISNNPNTITGLDIIGSGEFNINKFPFDIKGFFMINRFSDLLYETNQGVLIETRKPEHFLIELGLNFKSYKINLDAREEFNINKSRSKLNENYNLMYLITAYLMPHTHDWNIGISLTNVDYYIINQSTNPVFNLQFNYKLKSNLAMNIDAWYKQAGILNINANYFGYFFRGGIKWEI